jgi:phospholipase/lecithinase/hemolysin
MAEKEALPMKDLASQMDLFEDDLHPTPTFHKCNWEIPL